MGGEDRVEDITPSVNPDEVFDLIRGRQRRGMTTSQLVAHFLSVPDTMLSGRSEARRVLRAGLRELVRDGRVVRGRGKRYFAVEFTDLVSGRLRVTAGGVPLVDEGDGGEPPIRIPRKRMGGALDGDRVLVRLERARKRAREESQREGVVVQVLERARKTVVGRWLAGGHKPSVQPVERSLPFSILPTGSRIDSEPVDGEYVLVSLDSVSEHDNSASGELLERLGMPGDPGVEERVVMRVFDLAESFPVDVEAEAASFSGELAEADLAGRWDLRDRPAITIDPETARDFDDAVNAYPGDGDAVVVEVHIADVGHYVRPASALDAEARRRGTSVYLPGRCVPMLPERVSGELCCLRQGEDSLTMTVRFAVGGDGEVMDYEIGESVIRSRRRCTYGEAFDWLEAPRERWPEGTEEFAPSLQLLATAATRLGGARRLRGSLDFDLAEAELVLDSEGRVVDVQPSVRTRAHRLIEELMVTANSCVARRLLAHERAALHRVHDRPSPAKLEDLRSLVGEFGHRLDGDAGDVPPESLQRLLAAIAGRPEERLLATAVLRSLARAVYSPESRGHYALALDAYLHFTSPIRRYPDLVCHRELRRLLRGDKAEAQGQERTAGDLARLAEACSAAEQKAEAAERMAVQWKTVLYLRERIGEVFDGHLTGVTSFGVFVQLDEVLIDGMIHVTELADDYYVHEEGRHRLVGERTRRTYRLGDPIRVELVRVDVEAMQVGLVPVERSTRAVRRRS